jgi:hypothetical protein
VETALLSSELPQPQDLATLRLPHRACCVWLAQPAQVGEGTGVVPSMGAVADGLMEMGPEAHFDMVWDGLETLDQVVGYPAEAYLEGVVLLADDEGHARDEVAWIVRVAPVPPGRWRRGIVLARKSAAGWRGLLELLTAVVAWGDWRPPPSIRDWTEQLSRQQLRQLRFGATKRAEELGALARVRVLETRPQQPRRPGAEGRPHASPVTHLRRGRWRRQPVGPR